MPRHFEVNRAIGKRIFERRLQVGVDVEAMCKCLGVTQMEYLSWERGDVRIPPVALSEIGSLLSVPIVSFARDLLDESEQN
jgi:transcriptional regulator with XRE-family HTH domain